MVKLKWLLEGEESLKVSIFVKRMSNGNSNFLCRSCRYFISCSKWELEVSVLCSICMARLMFFSRKKIT